MIRADTFDSRDVIARLAELEAASFDWQGPLDGICSTCGDTRDEHPADPEDGALVYCPDDLAELRKLRELAEEGETYASDWPYGATFIADDYFEDYARELAEDIGAVDRDAAWPTTYIDWPAAAKALQADYTSIELDGFEFWVR
jgi:hypothetical protein